MSKAAVKERVREMREKQRIPEDYYLAKIFDVNEVKGGQGSKHPGAINCQAVIVIESGYDIEKRQPVELDDEALAGRKFSNFWLGSPDTGNWSGLLRILDAGEYEDIPEGEEDEEGNPLVTNMKGCVFPCRSVCNPNGYQGRVENNCIPEIDPAYLEARNKEAFEAEDEDEEEEEPEPAPRRRRETTKKKKKATRRSRSR